MRIGSAISHEMVRTTVRVLKFLKLVSKDKFPFLLSNISHGTQITLYEYDFAVELLLSQAQTEGLSGEEMEKYNLYYMNGLWRCKGRLQFPTHDSCTSYLICLPRHNRITETIIQTNHERIHHGGIPHTISELKRLYWIPKGRAEVKRVLNKCYGCKRWKTKPFKLPPMPNYPESRIERSRTFARIGLDYLGPVNAKTENGLVKRWIALFTCFTTRAVHLELVEDLSAENFLTTLRRFVARRGYRELILSDNASQFQLVFRAIKNQESQLANFLIGKRIIWRNITPKAPWSGGIYERIVGITKGAFRRAIGRRLLKEKDIITLVIEIESIIITAH